MSSLGHILKADFFVVFFFIPIFAEMYCYHVMTKPINLTTNLKAVSGSKF